MKLLIIFTIMLASLHLAGQQNGSTREQMAKIRQSTNWDDPAAAKKANEQIRELSKKMLLNTGQNRNPAATTEQMEEMAEDKMQLLDQVLKSASGGEQADVLLGEPIRKKIVREFQEDEVPNDINPIFLQETNMLVIDMTSPGIQQTIAGMKSYKGIQTLVITGGNHGAPVNLTMLLTNAANYPLRSLYIINFGNNVKNIPPQVSQFKNLHTLALFNNALKELPPSLDKLSGIDSLFVDQNPIVTLEPVISNLRSLKKLGVAKTTISQVELQRIHNLLPNCQILEQ